MVSIHRQRGFTFLEFVIVAAIVFFLIVIILNAYNDAVREDRRSIAQRAIFTVAGLQERWFVKKYRYADNIEQVGGADIGGEYYKFVVTQAPCGSTQCFTIMARFSSDKAKDPDCERMTLNSLGVKKAYNFANKDTTDLCWSVD